MLNKETSLDYLKYYQAKLNVYIPPKDKQYFENRRFSNIDEVERAVRGYGIYVLHKVHLARAESRTANPIPRRPNRKTPWRFAIFRTLTKLAWRLAQ